MRQRLSRLNAFGIVLIIVSIAVWTAYALSHNSAVLLIASVVLVGVWVLIFWRPSGHSASLPPGGSGIP